MTQEKIVSEVETRLGKTQVSKKTITDVVVLLPLAEGTEPDDAYYEKIVGLCKSFQGNIDSVATSAVTDAKTEWEKNNKPPTKTKKKGGGEGGIS